MSDMYDDLGGETMPETSWCTFPFLVDGLIRKFISKEVLQSAHGEVSRAVKRSVEEENTSSDWL